jgi:hypothetical protein
MLVHRLTGHRAIGRFWRRNPSSQLRSGFGLQRSGSVFLKSKDFLALFRNLANSGSREFLRPSLSNAQQVVLNVR